MANSRDISIVNNDLYITNGDFFISDSDVQHVSDTLAAFPGWWKEDPADGVGMLAYMNSSGKEQEIERKIRIQLTADGYNTNPSVIVNTSGQLTINPNATKI